MTLVNKAAGRRGLLARIVIITLTLLCSTHAAAESAIDVVTTWLAHLDEANYETTWQTSAPLFQQQISQEKWRSAALAARQPLGDFKSRKLMVATYRSELPDVAKGDYIIFKFQSQFTERVNVIETITPMLVDGQWRVSGYFVK